MVDISNDITRIRKDAAIIIDQCIKSVSPEDSVVKALQNKELSEKVTVIAIGKAAWNMANAAKKVLGERILKGLVVTKYDHAESPIEGFEIIEAGHPIPDSNSLKGASKAVELVAGLEGNDLVFLISGGGSSLFEKPMDGITLDNIKDITDQLLSSGADIVEINTIRKRLSAVKGGRFAKQCGDSNIFTIVLSDVVGDRLDFIASGPVYPDSSTSDQALKIIKKYGLSIDEKIIETIKIETPKNIRNCETVIAGSVTELCLAAATNAKKLGYEPLILSSMLEAEAKEAGKIMASIAKQLEENEKEPFIQKPCAIIIGGETIVRIRGNGTGGRNQELALSAAIEIEGLDDTVIFSLASDGTDGPTDVAGGIIDGKTASRIRESGMEPEVYLDNNDSYNALKASGDLINTGPTGTNVNDVTVLLYK